MKNFARYLVYTNIFIGACAAALTAETYTVLGLPLALYWYILLLFLSTVFVYSLHYYAKLKKPDSKEDQRLRWYFYHRRLLPVMIVSSAILIAGGVLFHANAIFFPGGTFSWLNLSCFILVPLLSLAYSHPFRLFRSDKKTTLRQFGLLKLLLLAFTWAFTTTILPVIMLAPGALAAHPLLLPLFIQHFVFIGALSVLFNVRDYEEDKRDHIRTLAVVLGPATTLRKAGRLAVLVNTVVNGWLLWNMHTWSEWLVAALFIPVILLWLGFNNFPEDADESLFIIRFDGLMILKAALLIFAVARF